MAHFSDELHLEVCTGMNCTVIRPRTEMAKKPGGRSWFCKRCYERRFGTFPKNPD